MKPSVLPQGVRVNYSERTTVYRSWVYHGQVLERQLSHTKEAVANCHCLHPAAPRPLTTKLRLRHLENFTTSDSIPVNPPTSVHF